MQTYNQSTNGSFEGVGYIQYNVFLSINQTILEITKYVTKLEFYNSIQDKFIKGKIRYVDSGRFLNNLKMSGEEMIIIVFYLKNGNTLTKRFYQHAIDDIKHDETNTIMKFDGKITSVLEHYSELLQLGIGYPDTTISSVFKNVLSMINVEYQEKIIEDTSDKIKNLSIPYWSVNKIFDKLLELSTSPKYVSPYFLFETMDNKIFFASLEKIIEISKTKEIKKFTNFAHLSGLDYEDNISDKVFNSLRNVSDFAVISRGDSLQKIKAGGYSNELYTIDLLNRKVVNTSETISNAKSFIKQTPNDNDFKSTFTDTFIDKKYIGKRFIKIVNDQYHNRYRVYSQGKIFMEAFNSLQIGFAVSGDFDLNPGDIIDFYAPSSPNDETENKDLSGKYIISNLRHDITGNFFFTTIEANKLSE